MLTLASLAVAILPFRILFRSTGTDRSGPTPNLPDGQAAEEMAQAVESMSRRIPWRTVCIHQALALHWMLRWRAIPSVLHFGIDPGAGQLSAHVWVSLDEKILIGQAEVARHAQVATFPGSG